MRPQRARRKLDGARVSASNLPVEPSWSCRRRAPRHGCQPCLRGSRPSSRVPSALSLSASRFRDTHSTRTAQPTGTCRAPATVAARWMCVRVADGTTTALHPGPGKEGPARVPQATAGLSPPPAWAATGGRQPLRVEGGRPLPRLKGRRLDRPDQSRRSRRPRLSVARSRAAPPPEGIND